MNSPTGKYVYVEEPGKPGRLVPVLDWPKGCEPPAPHPGERAQQAVVISTWDLFEKE